ncbi:hypothetical protein [Demequina litorisediminis]|uniref:Uncharacterized protein n=1 Tax=Demequina litorisediminis TaxID=1849022 RepID=A0ABQ6IDM9_9MICO|nr:hypothetical protein [Demequina litorisediminis]GMA35963.1 hypothetical protein GCM10025876_21670 [Demequina litorisediminis]
MVGRGERSCRRGAPLVMTYVPWLWSGSFDSYLLPTWYTVVNLLAALVSGVLFPLAAVLIGAAILINVLVPRIDARHASTSAPASASAPVLASAPVSAPADGARRDAVGLADTSRYEPPAG